MEDNNLRKIHRQKKGHAQVNNNGPRDGGAVGLLLLVYTVHLVTHTVNSTVNSTTGVTSKQYAWLQPTSRGEADK